MSCHVDFLFKQNKTKQKKLICSVSFTIYIRQQQWITMPIRFTYQLNIHMINKQRNELCDRSKKKIWKYLLVQDFSLQEMEGCEVGH